MNASARWPRVFLVLALLLAAAEGLSVACNMHVYAGVLGGAVTPTPIACALCVAAFVTHLAFVIAAPVLTFAAFLGAAVYRRI